MNIEEIALDWAREWLDDNVEMGTRIADTEFLIKRAINIYYPGGWEAFYNETFSQEVA